MSMIYYVVASRLLCVVKTRRPGHPCRHMSRSAEVGNTFGFGPVAHIFGPKLVDLATNLVSFPGARGSEKKMKFRQAWSEYEGDSGSSMYPKGDLDRKRATKKNTCFARKSHMFFCDREKLWSRACQKWLKNLAFFKHNFKNYWKSLRFLVFHEIFNSGRAGYFVPGGGGNMHAKPGRARQVPPEMAMNV